LYGIEGLEESSVYQGIFRRGRVQEARQSLLRQGRKQLGPPNERVGATVAMISDLDRLHELADRIFDVSSWEELLVSDSPSA
jgi:hypothetical protein